jgi:hypothetical protein
MTSFPQPPKNSHKKLYTIVLILIIVGLGVSVIFVPVNHTVSGTIEKWVLYNDYFYLKIDGQEYWLKYTGYMNEYPATAVQGQISYFNNIFNVIEGHWKVTLQYSSSLLFPQGNAPLYANNIQITLSPF